MRLSADDLHCHRGGRDVFAGVSFAVGSGEALIVIGRNGAGKSSLLRGVIGLVRVRTPAGGPPAISCRAAAGRWLPDRIRR